MGGERMSELGYDVWQTYGQMEKLKPMEEEPD